MSKCGFKCTYFNETEFISMIVKIDEERIYLLTSCWGQQMNVEFIDILISNRIAAAIEC